MYLSDDLKAGLTALAQRWARSEAELLRLAVERLIASARDEAAPTASAARGREPGPLLIGVGVGPSDPALVTQRAVRSLQGADRVFAATTGPDVIGRAEAITRTVAPGVKVERVVLDIAGASDARAASLEAAADMIVDALDPGAVVAFVTLGDPNMYSTFPALARAIARRRPSVPVRTIPGVMAFQELAAEAGTVLAEDDDLVTVLVAHDDHTSLDRALADPTSTVVVYKGGRHVPEVARRLRAHDRLDGAVVGEMLGMPGGRWVDVAAVEDEPASYLATVVVPASRPDEP